MTEDDKPKETKFVDTLLCVYIVSVLSQFNAEIFTYPLDLVKTRLQIQGEKHSIKEHDVGRGPYRGMIKTAVGIVKEEGPLKLWSGISAIWLRHVFYGSRVVIYRKMKDLMVSEEDKIAKMMPVHKALGCSVTSGVCAQFIANPADLLKVQMQMEGRRRAMGLPPRVHGITDAFQKVWASGGVVGFWKGAVPGMCRGAAAAIGDIGAYDVAKGIILHYTGLEDGKVVQSMSSLVAGFVSALAITPFDMVRARIMNQPVDEQGKGVLYKSMTDCFIQSILKEGPLVIYKGFIPSWLRLGPWAFVFWMTYERILPLFGDKAWD